MANVSKVLLLNTKFKIQYTIAVVFNLNAKKIISLILIWFVSYQTLVFASFEQPLEFSPVKHCENENMTSHDCCLDLVTTTHCSSCFQTSLALTSDLSMALESDTHGLVDVFKEHYHTEPLLKLFKPPI